MDYKKLSRITDSVKVSDGAVYKPSTVDEFTDLTETQKEFWKKVRYGRKPQTIKLSKELTEDELRDINVGLAVNFFKKAFSEGNGVYTIKNIVDSSKVQDSEGHRLSIVEDNPVLSHFCDVEWDGDKFVVTIWHSSVGEWLSSLSEDKVPSEFKEAWTKIKEESFSEDRPNAGSDPALDFLINVLESQGIGYGIDEDPECFRIDVHSEGEEITDSAKSFFEDAKEKIETALDEGEEYVEFESEFSPEEFDLANLEDWVEETTEQMVKASIESEGGIYKVTLHYEDI